MTLLKSIQRGKQPLPPRLVLYGTEGIGKSTFGSQCPAPVFIQTEDGLAEIDCDKFPLATSCDVAHLLSQFLKVITELIVDLLQRCLQAGHDEAAEALLRQQRFLDAKARE